VVQISGCSLGAFCLAMLYRTPERLAAAPWRPHMGGSGQSGVVQSRPHIGRACSRCGRLRRCGCRGFPYVPPVIARAQCYCLYDMKFYYSNNDTLPTVRDCVVDRRLRDVCKFWGPCGHVCGRSGVYFAEFCACKQSYVCFHYSFPSPILLVMYSI
jgi:hypothetical protein